MLYLKYAALKAFYIVDSKRRWLHAEFPFGNDIAGQCLVIIQLDRLAVNIPDIGVKKGCAQVLG